MNLADLGKRITKLASDNSPTILTAIGVAGTLSTALLAGRASYKAAELIKDHNEEQDIHDLWMPTREKIELVWRLYIPAAGVAALTVTSIICANRIGTRRAAAMAAAYAISEKAFVEYRDKVVEKIGANKEREVRDELAQDRVSQHPVGSREVVITGGGEVLCYDSFTGRYFKSSMETLKKAQNDLNYRVLNDYYASLTDFYNLIGLARTSYSDEVGWNSDKMLELQFSTTLSEDGQPCLAMEFAAVPIRDFYRLS
jgi:hypothetical protein